MIPNAHNPAAHSGDPPWLRAHAHEPNPTAPPGDGSFLFRQGADDRPLTLASLHTLPYHEVDGCYIVSTGHGASGPFRFGGVRLIDLIAACAPDHRDHPWRAVDIESADGFGARLHCDDLLVSAAERPPLLAYTIDGAPLTRAQGLLRLIVPSETDDALRQIKWVARITLR